VEEYFSAMPSGVTLCAATATMSSPASLSSFVRVLER
jgi:hypothetical protein